MTIHQAPTDFFRLFRDLDAWQLHIYKPFVTSRPAWYGPTSAVVHTLASEAGIRAALQALHPATVAWGYNPRRHLTLPGTAMRQLMAYYGQFAASSWGSYIDALKPEPGSRPQSLRFEKGGECLLIEIAKGPNALLLYQEQQPACILVTARHRGRGGVETSARFWLDHYISYSGAVQRSRFASSHRALVDVYGRLRPRHEPASLLDSLAATHGDTVVALKHRTQSQHQLSRLASDFFRFDRDGSVVARLAAELRVAVAPVDEPTTRRLADELSAFDQEALGGYAGRFGWPVGVLDAPCLPGCDGTMSLYNRLCEDLEKSRTVPRATHRYSPAMIAGLGYRCSCRLLAGQTLAQVDLHKDPAETELGLPEAIRAGIAADSRSSHDSKS